MKCIIVDDDELSRIAIKYLCGKVDDLEIVATCEDALEAIKVVKNEDVDLIFLDIEMPSLSGIEFVKTFDQQLPYIIFVTSRPEYAVEAFEYKELVVDYITKPVDLARFLKAVDRARDTINSTEKEEFTISKDFMFIKTDGRLVRIDFEKLYYLETVGDYVRFKTDKDSYLIHSSMKKLEKKFQHNNFVKVHRSYIVNVSKIDNIEENSILVGGKLIPISRTHKTEVLNKLNPL